MMKLSDLLDRWATDEGKPYEGSLIDMDAYKARPDNIGCMCVQGQLLHLVGGWTPEQLVKASQYEADRKTADLLNISRAHAVLLRQVNDSTEGAPAIVLTDPGKVLGENWSTVLDLWCALDRPQPAAWGSAGDAAGEAAAGAAAWEAACEAAGDAAGEAAWEAAWGAAWGSAGDAAGDAAGEAAGEAAGGAAWAAARGSNEVQAAKIFRRDGRAFYFLPLFGFATPEDIPARPADYGMGCHSQETTE